MSLNSTTGGDDESDDILSLALEQSGLNLLPPITLTARSLSVPSLSTVVASTSNSLSSLILPLVSTVGAMGSDDLSCLLEHSDADFLNYALPPLPVSQPLHNTAQLLTPVSLSSGSDSLSTVENMNVNDVLLELGISSNVSATSQVKGNIAKRPPTIRYTKYQ